MILKMSFSDIIISPTKLYNNATPLEAAEMVMKYLNNYYKPHSSVFNGTLPFDVVDPFIGQGTVGLVAMKHNLTVLGLDIDQDQIDQCFQILYRRMETVDIQGSHNTKIVYDPVFGENRRILNVENRQLQYLRRHYKGHELSEFLSQLVQSENLEFPYKRYQYKEKDLLDSFLALKNLDFTQRLHILKNTQENWSAMGCADKLKAYVQLPIRYCDLGDNQGCYRVDPILGKRELLVYIQTDSDYNKFDWLSDYWTEDLRMSCQTDGNPSPLEKWYNPNDLARSLSFMLRPGHSGLGFNELTNVTLREGIFQDRLWRECTQFKPSLFYCLIKLLGAKTILDTSAGWGDRLIGAMAANVTTYTGIDPEVSLQKRYEMIYQTFQDFVCPNHSYYVFPYKSEDSQTVPKLLEQIPNLLYDMIFSSPPFFKYESYSNGFAKDYGDLDEQTWLNQFMYPTLHNTWRFLKKGGYYVLYLCDTSGRNRDVAFTSTETINLWIGNNLLGSQLVGTLGTGREGGKRYLTCWIWYKSI